jgi:hypothetical protein
MGKIHYYYYSHKIATTLHAWDCNQVEGDLSFRYYNEYECERVCVLPSSECSK